MFIKTISTTSGINPIQFDETGGVFYWILNTGSSTIYASTKAIFTAGDDGVVSLGPKESRRLETNNDTIYILGEGQVEIHNQRDGICSFKQAPTSSGGGGTIDAYTKTESDARYAMKTDVPDSYTKNESDAKYAQKTDVPDAYTKTESDAKYASKELYGDTTINVGRKAGSAVGEKSTAEGRDTIASGYWSHAEGINATASGNASHAEGGGAIASDSNSHAEGYNTIASGHASHAEGLSTVASGRYSHAEGENTIANNGAEHASGRYNVSNEDTLFSIGDGTANDARHNAFEITKTGGKLHDRDVGVSFTQAETAALRIEIPDDVDAAQWLTQNAKSGMQYFISSKGSHTGLPNVSADWMWFSYDGNRYFARAWAGGTHTADFVLDAVNSVGGWKEISYTPIKSTTVSAATDEHGFFTLWSHTENKIPVAFRPLSFPDMIFIPMSSTSNWTARCVHSDFSAFSSITIGNVKVFYIEI